MAKNRVRFSKDFTAVFAPRFEVAYPAGFEGVIPQAHAEQAEQAGVIERIEDDVQSERRGVQKAAREDSGKGEA